MVQLKLNPGKADFISRKSQEGKIEKICLCDYNADFAFACMGQVHGSLLREVVENKGCYTKENIKGYRKRGLIDNRCEYCYAKRKNWGKVIPKTIGKLTKEQFDTEKPKIIRLGKNTECGHYFYRKVLFDFLELCEENKARIIFPTKMLEFNKDIARFLKKTDSVVNYSICNDSFEIGPVSQGFSNEWRIKQARKYDQAGVNTTLTITCDVTQSIEENIKYGFYIERALKQKERGMIIRLLPIRFNSKKICQKATGEKWEKIILPRNYNSDNKTFDFYEEWKWRYSKKGNNEAIPLFFHEDFKKLIEEYTGVCGTVGDFEYCDKCNLQGKTRVFFPKSEIIPVIYSNNRINYKRYRNKDKKDISKDKQILLFNKEITIEKI